MAFDGGPLTAALDLPVAQEMVTSFLKDISITNLLLSLLGTAAHIVEDVMYILLDPDLT